MLKRILIVLFIMVFNLPVFAEDKIHVAFCIDNNYPLYTMLAINSILLNNTSNSKYYFHIVENNVSKFHKFQMKYFVKNRGADIEFIHFDTRILDKGRNYYRYEGNTKKWNGAESHITRIASARLALPEILPNIDKILYLDGDILVTTDLKNLWEIDLQDYYLGMVYDALHFIENIEYFNDGIILFNLDKIRKENMTNTLIYVYKDNPQLQYHDQDVLNIVFKNEIKNLPLKWNMQVRNAFPLEKNISVSGIFHFAGKHKPWEFYKYDRSLPNYEEYRNLYLKYWRKSYLKIYIPYYIFKAIPKLYFGIVYEEIMRMKYWN